MKIALLAAAFITLAVCMALLISYVIREENYDVIHEENYDLMCTVGKEYILCNPKNADPFLGRTAAHVTVLDKKEGYVQYAYTHELNNKSFTRFSRTYKEFIVLTNNCKL